MQENNPLPEIRSGETTVLPLGTYTGKFKGAEAIKRKNYDDPTILENAIRFVFWVETDTGEVEIIKDVSPSAHSKSNLYLTVKGMLGARFDPHVLADKQTLWLNLVPLIGQRFTLMCEPNDSGTFTKIWGVAPAPSETNRPGPHKPSQPSRLSGNNSDLDDIPF